MSRPDLGPIQSPTQWVLRLSPRVTELGNNVDHSPPSNAEVRIGGDIPLLPLNAFRARTGTNLCFTL